MKRAVLSKKDFVRRYLEGEFGNAPRSWIDLETFKKEANPSQRYHVRIARVGYPVTFYDVPFNEVEETCYRVKDQLDLSDIYISEMGPEAKKIFQGEVMESPMTFLKYNLLALPMRQAFQIQTLYAVGLTARILLREYLDSPSLEWLEFLLESYPDHVIEFSTYSIAWGILGWNTVFWEVRKY